MRVLVAVCAVIVLGLLAVVAGLGAGSAPSIAGGRPLPASRPVAGPPSFQALARQGSLTLYVPVDQRAITAVAYHGVAGSNAFSLQPIGQQANAGFLRSLVHRVFGDGSGGVRYDVTDGSTQAVDVGAPAGTAVYAPVSGVVVSLPPLVLNGDSTHYGVVVGIQPTSDPSVVVQVSHVRVVADPRGAATLEVGQRVERGSTRLGTVVDLGNAMRSALAPYVSDSGAGVAVQVVPAPAGSLP